MSVEAGTDAAVSSPSSAANEQPPWRTWRTRSLLLYGLVVAVLATALLDLAAPRPWPIEGSRAAYLHGALVELDTGGPPLWGRYATRLLDSKAGAGGSYYGSTSPGDDQGAFFYVPGLAHLLGIHDALAAMRLLYLALFFVPLLFYPLVFERLFSSTAAGLVAPWALLASLGVLGFHDILWITEWAAFALLPPLMLLNRRWPRRGLLWLTLLVVGASFANSVRAQAGLGVALAALIVVLARPWRWRWRLASMPLLLVAYLSISTFGLAGLRAWRADSLGHGFHDAASSHIVWHPLYLGLGYLPNRYGLRWDDQIAINAAAAYRPAARYPTAAYDAAVRHLFLRLVERDPGLLARSVGAKLLVVLLFGAPALLLLALIGVAMAADRARAAPLPRHLMLVAPTLLVSLPSPLLAMPFVVYQLGLLAALELCCILAVAWLTARLYAPRETGHRVMELRSAARTWIGRSWLHAVALPVIVAVLAVVTLAGHSIQQRAARWQATTPAVPAVIGALSRPPTDTEQLSR